MSAWFEAPRQAGAAGPRTHAFVLGVSRYEHLPKRAQDPTDDTTFNLRQLESAATSAVRFARWMRDTYHQPDAPLQDLWLLLSPSTRERRSLSAEEKAAARATRDAVQAALDEWRAACEADRDGVAVFYAAGHGIVLGVHEGGILLLEDFAADPNRRLDRALSMVNARSGLAGDKAPRTQYWFLDACQPLTRNIGDAALQGAGLPGWDGHVPERTDVSPIFMSAATGTLAFGAPGKGTLFSQALEECLELRAVKLGDPDGWVVTDAALGRRLRERVGELAQDKGAEQTADLGGRAGDAAFHVLRAPPQLPVTVAVLPEAAGSCSLATMTPEAGAPVFARQPLQQPLKRVVAAGQYAVEVEIEPPRDPFRNRVKPVLVAPNRAELIEVEVG
jgi:hypothetical protein